VEIVTTWSGGPRYELVTGLRADPDVWAYALAAADCDLTEQPGQVWVLAVDEDGVAAWCAYHPGPGGHPVQCVDSVELPRAYGSGAYRAAFLARHELLRRCPCVTYVYADPLALHLEHGWRYAGRGRTGDGRDWYRLIRDPDMRKRPPPTR
jgi:hypothetical protein